MLFGHKRALPLLHLLFRFPNTRILCTIPPTVFDFNLLHPLPLRLDCFVVLVTTSSFLFPRYSTASSDLSFFTNYSSPSGLILATMVRNTANLTISPVRPGRRTDNLASPYLKTTPAEYPFPSAGFNTTPSGPVYPAHVLDARSAWPANLNPQDDHESEQANQIYDFSPALSSQNVNSSDSFNPLEQELFGDYDLDLNQFNGIQNTIPELPEETGLAGDAAVPAQAVAPPATTANHVGQDGSSKATAHNEQLATPDLTPPQQAGSSVVEPAVVILDDELDPTPPSAASGNSRKRARSPSVVESEPPKKRKQAIRQSRATRLTQTYKGNPKESWKAVKQRTGMSLAVPGAKRIDLPPANVPWPGRQPQLYDIQARSYEPDWMRFQQEQAWRNQGDYAYQNQYGSHGNFEQYPSGFGQYMPGTHQQAGLRNQNQPFQYQQQSHNPSHGSYSQNRSHQQQQGEFYQQNYGPYANNRPQQRDNGWNAPQNDPFARQMQQMHSNLPNQQANYAQSQQIRPARPLQQPLYQQNQPSRSYSSQYSGNTYIPRQTQRQQQFLPQTPARQLMPTMAPTPGAPRLPATYDTGIRREAGRGGRGGGRGGVAQARPSPISIDSQGSPVPNDRVRDGATEFGFPQTIFFGESAVPQTPTTRPANPDQCFISVPRDLMSNFGIVPDPLATSTIFQQAPAQGKRTNTSALDNVNFSSGGMSDQQLEEVLLNATRDVAAPALPTTQAYDELGHNVAEGTGEADLDLPVGDFELDLSPEDFEYARTAEWADFDGGSHF
ncbi:uncharacterized protein AB675_7038 [Cyphellophora attinorum]|uniref:Uncharacterized protein n=1 Tax=Cyphellophora attinorum TaxID=1664694 RepID=A0A0N1H8Q3_9EURO|nr:uncharacterized protein AB675_7038 [Phialophora attinorum]KPI43506.1 hypothetical protein AB675_7038 [Phialophora attinorum]